MKPTRLTDLDGRFIQHHADGSFAVVDTLAVADGVIFQCPLCAQKCEPGVEDGRRYYRGAHSVICWFLGKVPDGVSPGPGRWTPRGTGLEDLTFVQPPDSVSVFLTGPGCGWHGHIRNGEATLS